MCTHASTDVRTYPHAVPHTCTHGCYRHTRPPTHTDPHTQEPTHSHGPKHSWPYPQGPSYTELSLGKMKHSRYNVTLVLKYRRLFMRISTELHGSNRAGSLTHVGGLVAPRPTATEDAEPDNEQQQQPAGSGRSRHHPVGRPPHHRHCN